MARILLVFCTLLACSFALPQRAKDLETTIVGGEKAERGQFPYIVQLQQHKLHDCGGTIVNENWIVTAAHCVKGAPNTYTVVANQYNILVPEGDERKHAVAEILIHPNYVNEEYHDDIALVKVQTPIIFDKLVQPVVLPSQAHRAPVGTEITIAGWGALTEGGRLPIFLQFVKVPVVSDDYCANVYGKDIILPDKMLCAGTEEGGKDSCSGDSGGPAVCNDSPIPYLCGIVSFGSGCARPGIPGVNTEVAEYVEWILANAV